MINLIRNSNLSSELGYPVKKTQEIAKSVEKRGEIQEIEAKGLSQFLNAHCHSGKISVQK